MSEKEKDICVFCDYARMRDDICGIYCVGQCMKKPDGTCDYFKPYQSGPVITPREAREKLVERLRGAHGSSEGICMCDEAADLLENDLNEVDALQAEIESLRKELDEALHDIVSICEEPNPFGCLVMLEKYRVERRDGETDGKPDAVSGK